VVIVAEIRSRQDYRRARRREAGKPMAPIA